MPIIEMTTTTLEKEKKEQLIEAFTKAAVAITGVPEQFHMVVIHELSESSLGVGTKTLENFKKEMVK